MSEQIRRVYWDTGLFLCFLNPEEKERRQICEDNLKHARDGEIEIYTSYWTLVEVIRPKGWTGQLSADQVQMLKGMFQWSWLKKVQVHQTVAFKAADLSREFNLKPADAIHAATAIIKGVDAMQVFDRDFSKISHLVKVERPTFLTKLPLLDGTSTIGPTPEKIAAAASPQSSLAFEPLPSVLSLPPALSPGGGSTKAPAPAPGLPSPRPDAQGQPPPDSSPTAAQPPPSEK